LQLYEDAIRCWQVVIEQYSDFLRAPHSLFLQGFVYENNLKDLKKAREKYNAFLEKYLEHELQPSVQFSLDHLGVSEAEIVKEFERKLTTQQNNGNES